MEGALIAYFSALIATMVVPDPWRLAVFLVGSVLVGLLYTLMDRELAPVVRSINYSNLGMTSREREKVASFVAGLIALSLYAILATAFTFTQIWWCSLPVLLAYLIAILALMKRVEVSTSIPGTYRPVHPHWPTSSSNAVVVKATPFPKKHYPADGTERPPGVPTVPVPSAYRDREPEESSPGTIETERWKRL
jgi:hypothetical protein